MNLNAVSFTLSLQASGPLRDLLNEVANRERARLEANHEIRDYEQKLAVEAQSYGVPYETLRKLDAQGLPWRTLLAKQTLAEMAQAVLLEDAP